jgi:hypothetical protein
MAASWQAFQCALVPLFGGELTVMVIDRRVSMSNASRCYCVVARNQKTGNVAYLFGEAL